MSIPHINAEIIPCKNEQGWLAERCKRVQASDGFRILDNEAFAVYTDKVSPPLVCDRPEAFELKLESEHTVRKVYQKKYGGRCHAWPAYTIAASKKYPWLGSTPDSLVEDPTRKGIGIHQIKCWSEYDRKSWVEAPPLYVQVQTQIEMICCDVQWGVIAVMFGTQSLDRFYVERNESFIEAMLPVLRDFYTCMELRVPPAVDGSASTTLALARLHPLDNGLAVHLPEESDKWVATLRRAKSLAKRLGKRAEEFENLLRAAIGDNTFGVTPSGEWLSWKSQTRKSFTVSESTHRVFRECKEPHQIEYIDGNGTTGIDYKVAERVKLPQWLKVKLLNDRGRCRWCGCQLTMKTASFEHVVALAVGGTNDETNIDISCVPCNTKRGSDSTMPVSVGAIR